MSRRTRKKFLASAINTGTYGTDAINAGTPLYMKTFDLDIQPIEGEDVDTTYDNGDLGSTKILLIGNHVKVTGSVDLTGAGTDVDKPAYDPVLVSGGWQGTIGADSVVYAKVTDGTEKDVTFYVYKDGALHVVLGARLTTTYVANVGEKPRIEFDITGLLGDILYQASLPQPDTSAFIDPVQVGATHTEFTIGGTKHKMTAFSLADNVQVVYDENSEAEEVFISDFAPEVTFTIQAPPLNTFNPFDIALNHQEIAIKLVHGTGTGNIVEINLPSVQLMRPAYDSREGRDTYALTGRVLGSGYTITTK
jgi:hypothetical protein